MKWFLAYGPCFISALFAWSAQAQTPRHAPPTPLGKVWHHVPSREGAPAFQFQIAATAEGVRFQVLLEATQATAGWALQAWFGVPDVVTLRQARVIAARQARDSYRALWSDEAHQDAPCQEAISAFLASAQAGEERLKAYDPFHQVVYGFESTPPGPESWAFGRESLHPVPLGAGRTAYAGVFALHHFVDVANPRLKALAYHFALVPAADIHGRPVRESDLHTFSFPTPIDLVDEVLPSCDRVQALWTSQDGLYLATPEGLHPADPAEVIGLPCVGAEGPFHAPDQWQPVVFSEVEAPEGARSSCMCTRWAPAWRCNGRGRSRWCLWI